MSIIEKIKGRFVSYREVATMAGYFAFALMAVAMPFISCCEDDDPVPSQKEIESKIVGKWKRTTENGKPVATNRSSVLTYYSDGTSTRSYYYYDASIKKASWYAKSPVSYTLDGNQMCEREMAGGFYSEVYLYSEILSINDNELTVLNTRRLTDGKEEVVNQNRTYTRVTKDFSKDIIGMWRGVSSTNDTYGNSDHYWLYCEDGTYSYFTKNEDGRWGTFDNILNEYTVDGDWLAFHWITTDNTDNCECWNIDKIEGDHMYWSAIREQDGKQVTSTFELERVPLSPTWNSPSPGQIVSDLTIAALGEMSFFREMEIPDTIFSLMQGKSFKEDCTVPRSDLRYLLCLHRDINGSAIVGEMVVNKKISSTVLNILHQLYLADYPIERMRLVDYWDADDEMTMRDNNSSSFNFRFISHTTKVSKHGKGIAVDINTLYNPYHKFLEDGTEVIEPQTGAPYLDRSKSFPYKIEKGDLCYKLFTENGFEWGGDWTTVKDYQHFELIE